MAEDDVEEVLREIRTRVCAEQKALGQSASLPTQNENGRAMPLQQRDSGTSQVLARLQSHLITTERAWDRLPPVVSKRSGALARLELWIKRNVRRATRWYAWEQINFNAAVSHSLRDIAQALSDQAQQLEALREQRRHEIDEVRDNVDAKIRALETKSIERDERLNEEQRVCFKQLSLETSEAAALEDRARRGVQAALEELKQRLDKLEGR